MITAGLRSIHRFGRSVGKATNAVVSGLGVEKEVDTFQLGLESLPGVDQLKKIAQAVADEVFPEELPLYKEEAGPHKVAVHKEKFVDEARGRNIPLTVYYPEKSEEPSPVVVLSHGLAGNSETYKYFGQHLASHGYTVMQPVHEGSDTEAVLKKTILFAFTQDELADRAADVSFVLDQMENGGLPESVTKSADLENVAVAGHSFGALTVQGMAGLEAKDDNGDTLELEDDRVDAFIAMSPYGDSLPSNLLGFDLDTYDNINQPVLFLHGENDSLFTLGKGANAHSLPFQEAASEDKYQVIVGGARHVSFAQVFGIADPETTDMTKSTSVAFLDAHLKQQPEAQAYLADELSEVARSRDSLAFKG